MIPCWACRRDVDPTADADGYARCEGCGLRFAPSGKAPRSSYDSDYFAAYKGGDYIATEHLRRHEARDRLRLLPAPRPGADRLLEIGSAAGFFLDEAQKAGWSVTGVEPVADIADLAKTSFGVDVRVGFVEDLDLSDLSVDAVCAWHTLEHIPDPATMLNTVRGQLRPGGTLAVEVPNGASHLARRLGSDWFALEPDVHVAQWTPQALRELLLGTGFADVCITTVPFLTYVDGARARAIRRVNLAMRQRRWIGDPHPADHELLRAVVCRARTEGQAL